MKKRDRYGSKNGMAAAQKRRNRIRNKRARLSRRKNQGSK